MTVCAFLGVQDDEGDTLHFYLADMTFAGGESGDIYIAGYVYDGEYAGITCFSVRVGFTGRMICQISLPTIFAPFVCLVLQGILLQPLS